MPLKILKHINKKDTPMCKIMIIIRFKHLRFNIQDQQSTINSKTFKTEDKHND